MNTGTLARLVLLLALAFDVTYGVLTYNTPYGCTTTAVTPTIHTANQTIQQPGGVNLKVLAEPCFYIYYFGIFGGSALVISLIPTTKKKVTSVE